jgi:hypothetical protein
VIDRIRGPVGPLDTPRALARVAVLGFALCGLLACEATITRVGGDETPAPSVPVALPFHDTVSVTTRPHNRGYSDARTFQTGLGDALRKAGVFQRVRKGRAGEPTTLELRGDVRGHFESDGAANFFTWFFGPLVFAHNWRGTKHVYVAEAELELVETASGKVVGHYQAEVSYEFQHRSNNPGPILGALLIVPGLVKGAMSVDPREKHRAMIYQEAYPGLWQEVVAQIVADRAPYYHRLARQRRTRCGARYDAPPSPGKPWAEFRECQSRAFNWLRDENTAMGVEHVYQSTDATLRVNVLEDLVTSWHRPAPASPASPESREPSAQEGAAAGASVDSGAGDGQGRAPALEPASATPEATSETAAPGTAPER